MLPLRQENKRLQVFLEDARKQGLVFLCGQLCSRGEGNLI